MTLAIFGMVRARQEENKANGKTDRRAETMRAMAQRQMERLAEELRRSEMSGK
jgi:hypothetical protein